MISTEPFKLVHIIELSGSSTSAKANCFVTLSLIERKKIHKTRCYLKFEKLKPVGHFLSRFKITINYWS